jgi:hypothetical protein
LKARLVSALETKNVMNRFQTLLSISTCAATPGGVLRLREVAGRPGALGVVQVRGERGRAVQVDSIKIRVESAFGFSA